MKTELTVLAPVSTLLTWDYERPSLALRALYGQGKTQQWDADIDVPWGQARSIPDFSTLGPPLQFRDIFTELIPQGRWSDFTYQYQAWMVNQFLHGEQGALVATARLVETLPTTELKLYAASQVNDEARHVEAYARYVNDEIGITYPITAGLRSLLEDILAESRWDIIYLGMQVIVEGLALSATRIASTGFYDETIRTITRLVARDEARHVAFGAIALDGMYSTMTSPELRDREEFLLHSLHVMSRRFLLGDLWERFDVEVNRGIDFAKNSGGMAEFRQALFRKVIQILQRVGLLSPRIQALLVDEGLATERSLGMSRPNGMGVK